MITKGEQCSKQIPNDSRYLHYRSCSKRAVVERGGKLYCRIHDPEYIQAKQEKANIKWQKESREIIASKIALAACKEINPEHPELVAQNIKEMYEIILYLHKYCNEYIGETSRARIDSVLSEIKGGE